jgi:hypothetical protein
LANILELNIESVELLLLLLFYFQNLATIKPEKPSFFHHFEKFQSKGENLPKAKTLPLTPIGPLHALLFLLPLISIQFSGQRSQINQKGCFLIYQLSI